MNQSYPIDHFYAKSNETDSMFAFCKLFRENNLECKVITIPLISRNFCEKFILTEKKIRETNTLVICLVVKLNIYFHEFSVNEPVHI